ncbi:MAG: hypothetical protein V8T87_08335 [Victivallales bacterium]
MLLYNQWAVLAVMVYTYIRCGFCDRSANSIFTARTQRAPLRIPQHAGAWREMVVMVVLIPAFRT